MRSSWSTAVAIMEALSFSEPSDDALLPSLDWSGKQIAWSGCLVSFEKRQE
jgi:hypothetical protein